MESSLPFALSQGLITQLLESSVTVLTLFIYLGILGDANRLPPSPGNGMPAHAFGDEQARPLQVESGHGYYVACQARRDESQQRATRGDSSLSRPA